MELLIISRGFGLTWALPLLGAQAGFTVDVLTSAPVLRFSRYLRSCELVPHKQSLIPRIRRALKKNYDWIVIADEITIAEILSSDLSVEEKLRVLPVIGVENFIHLNSKIVLSQVFSRAGVTTPAFAVVRTAQEAQEAAEKIGYPVLVKKDFSCAGVGVVFCADAGQIDSLGKDFFAAEVLVQKYICGSTLDLSAIFFSGKLVYFSHATFKKVSANQFGPSSLRSYLPLAGVVMEIYQELSAIGACLGAHGFANITCIQQDDGQRFFFEADMRPNVWITMPKYFGDDPAPYVYRWFSGGEILLAPCKERDRDISEVVLPYFFRLLPHEFLSNRYQVWRYLPREEAGMVLGIFLRYGIPYALRRVVERIAPTLQKIF